MQFHDRLDTLLGNILWYGHVVIFYFHQIPPIDRRINSNQDDFLSTGMIQRPINTAGFAFPVNYDKNGGFAERQKNLSFMAGFNGQILPQFNQFVGPDGAFFVDNSLFQDPKVFLHCYLAF